MNTYAALVARLNEEPGDWAALLALADYLYETDPEDPRVAGFRQLGRMRLRPMPTQGFVGEGAGWAFFVSDARDLFAEPYAAVRKASLLGEHWWTAWRERITVPGGRAVRVPMGGPVERRACALPYRTYTPFDAFDGAAYAYDALIEGLQRALDLIPPYVPDDDPDVWACDVWVQLHPGVTASQMVRFLNLDFTGVTAPEDRPRFVRRTWCPAEPPLPGAGPRALLRVPRASRDRVARVLERLVSSGRAERLGGGKYVAVVVRPSWRART